MSARRLCFAGSFLILMSAFAPASVAVAQEACPLPAGMAPLAPPLVTAQQVEDGSASLMEFALAARDRYSSLGQEVGTLEGAAYAQCRIREEGSPWRSGSTYLVFLTPDGRVYEHAKSMSLSGRLLKPSIYGAILYALGIDPAGLTDPVAAFAAAAGNGGSFRVPGVPGASGYAAVYAANPTIPVLLAGFEIDESHLAQEEIDLGDPAITAAEVVDRPTLKAFVTEAIKYFVSLLDKGDPAALSQARTALRDENGPWKHGSVYLYALERTSNVIWFHGAFPDRFEYRPLVPSVRDVVTGELILPQVIEAALSDPEGGFVEYYFDDPADDTDSADIPKVGYARQLVVQIPRVDGTLFTLDFVVGSGFYGSSTEAAATDRNAVVEAILPQMMRAMTASTVDAVSSRIQQATSGAPPSRELRLAGASTLPDALLANRQALESGRLDLGQLLAGSSFTLAIDAADTGRRGLIGNLTLWGSGDYRNFSGGNQTAVAYDGNVLSANLGVDAKVGADVLAGVSVAQARGTADTTVSGTGSGELTTTVTSINPYVGWQASGGLNLWAMAGYGSGEVEVEDSAGMQASDLTQQMAAAGVSGPLVASDRLIAGGTTSLKIKGETAFTRAELDGSGALEGMTLNASRHRLMLEGSHVQDLASGATFTPSIEIGVRSDGGDGETGTSVEAGGGLRYADQATGLTVETRARTLLTHSGDYEEWGVNGLIRLDPGAAGQGLSFSVRPAWGHTASGVRRFWGTDLTGGVTSADQAHGRLDAHVGYGMMLFGGHFLGTPEVGLGLSEVGHEWRMGWRLGLAGSRRVSFNLGLEAARWEPAATTTAAENRVGLSAAMLW